MRAIGLTIGLTVLTLSAANAVATGVSFAVKPSAEKAGAAVKVASVK